MVNGPADVYVERKGRLERAPDRLFEGEETVLHVIERIVAVSGEERADRVLARHRDLGPSTSGFRFVFGKAGCTPKPSINLRRAPR
jgi:type IV secretory pathway ATPase VirB11/archaellum biosynthesis ATPase